jgi:hypothetical protein
MHAKKLGDFLNSGDGIGRLMPQAAVLLTLRRALSEALPEHLLRSCAIANHKQGKVFIFAASGAVAARLRLLEPRMLEVLSKTGLNVTGLNVEVQPMHHVGATGSEKKALRLSRDAARVLSRTGAQLPEGDLKRALDALARKGE